MNYREADKIETVASRIGGEMAEFGGLLKTHGMDGEYDEFMGLAKAMTDLTREIRRKAQDAALAERGPRG